MGSWDRVVWQVLVAGLLLASACDSGAQRLAEGSEPSVDATNDARKRGILGCDPFTAEHVSASALDWPDEARLAYRDGLLVVAAQDGEVRETEGANGRLTRIDYIGEAPDQSYSRVFAYTGRAGHLGRVVHDASGTKHDFTVDFSYGASGQLSRVDYRTPSGTDDFVERFDYTSGGDLVRFDREATDQDASVTERFAYTEEGWLTRYEHDAAGSEWDFTESFAYDARGRVVRFQHDGHQTDVSEAYQHDEC